ncbi:low molecular weight protein-tyrosine-phosphatase [Amantichitinum ursilacus]|uniref:protein-tyrosine-phosphatase n=1 Tax=Amantichitinum ursilacus TaxID=857265 RepID=A0A0N1JSN1_9NEIS|nr:low molecular weight protein-tyrosine-phosphatase [Amantichitinum ursilacus]KPC53048.1 Low molecular weight protein-tyrosine-phosphatase YfkJ [Amantichitinum ursilacus]
MKKYSVLMICTGNICRSPTADGLLRHLVRHAGWQDLVEVDSAGTDDYHVGEAPDRRAQQHARKRDIDLSTLRARQVNAHDYAHFDLILAMDNSHLRRLQQNAPAAYRHKIKLFLDFAPDQPEREVPDPYYGGPDGFEHVLDLVEAGCEGVMAHIAHETGLRLR